MISTMIVAVVLVAQAPKPVAPGMSAQRQAELRQTAEKRKQAAAKKAVQRQNQAKLDEAERRAQEAYTVKMAPVWQKQAADQAALNLQQQQIMSQHMARQAQLQIENRKAAAMESMANSARQEVSDYEYDIRMRRSGQ